MYLARFREGQDPKLIWESHYWPFLRADPVKLERIYRLSAAHVLADAWMPARGTVLDAGCGPGVLASINKYPDREIVGCDVSPGLLRIAQRLAPRARFELGSMESLPFPDASFDAYVSVSSLEFCRGGLEPALREAVRVLKPGGRAFAVCLRIPIEVHFGARNVTSTTGEFRLEAVEEPVDPFPPDGYGYYYKSSELIAAARGAGFDQASVRRCDFLGGLCFSETGERWLRKPIIDWINRISAAADDRTSLRHRLEEEVLLRERGLAYLMLGTPLRVARRLFSFWNVLEAVRM